ncbi:uncharacterized protein LOC123551717 isoform X3 [Mercenaria mercenaria]|uniref:uncharacterized protein LOC123551717 isoform X2 n=1 Tax=Mercenaria mercenaria TaxID=6596 RepID=UPI00234F416A|nr:uncharacterized protein LOC123551717 isoform X2 [Mercenaria mercenaria]XP_053397194.1 uncharacterized protein LOC123551717 isoform X3 [Mercenaria mercenaria]
MDLVIKIVLLFCLSQGLFGIGAKPDCNGKGANSCAPTTPTATTTTTTATIHSTNEDNVQSAVHTTTTATTASSKEPHAKAQGRQYKYEAVYIVIPVVAVVVVVAVIMGVVCCIKRRRIKLSLPRVLYRRNNPTETNSHGTAITNIAFNGAEVSLKESPTSVHTNQSLDSGYAEIPIGITEECPDNEYQTIDILPEDQTLFANTYGHLKDKSGCFDSKTYSHIGEKHTGSTVSKPENMNYSHIGKQPGQELQLNVSEDKRDITYNTLDTLSKLNIGRNVTNEKNKNNEEAEYNHAIAGRTGSLSEIKIPDEYAHLNSAVQIKQTHDMTVYRTVAAGNEDELHEMHRPGYSKDTEKLITEEEKGASVHYSKVIKTNATTDSPNKSLPRNDGYELAVALKHDYLILEPEKEPGNETDVQFHVAENEGFGERRLSECEESQNHQYFILEKNTNLS